METRGRPFRADVFAQRAIRRAHCAARRPTSRPQIPPWFFLLDVRTAGRALLMARVPGLVLDPGQAVESPAVGHAAMLVGVDLALETLQHIEDMAETRF